MASAVFLSWVSAVVRPNQTLIASGSGFMPPCKVELNSSSIGIGHAGSSAPPMSVHVSPVTLSSSSVMATVPPSFPAGRASVRLKCGSDWSNAVVINEPRVWWMQGSCGNTSHPGGTIRVLGDALASGSAGSSEPAALEGKAQSWEAKADQALKQKDYSTLASAAMELLALGRAGDEATPRLRLQGPGATEIILSAKQDTVNQYHAEFIVPLDTVSGDFTVSYAAGLHDAWVPIDFFESPSRPHVRQFTIREAALAPVGANSSYSFQVDTQCQKVPPGVFNIGDFAHSRVPQIPQHSGTLPLNTLDATAGLSAALMAARSHGGGTIYFPRGTYFLEGSFEIPTNTYLKGAGTSLVTLFWAEANSTHHPSVLFEGDPSAETITWGISDLTIYATAYAHLPSNQLAYS